MPRSARRHSAADEARVEWRLSAGRVGDEVVVAQCFELAPQDTVTIYNLQSMAAAAFARCAQEESCAFVEELLLDGPQSLHLSDLHCS